MAAGRPPSRERTTLGQRIAAARLQAGLTQTDLASRVKVSQRVIAYWEREAVSIRPEQAQALADALNLSTDDLLGLKAPKIRGSGPSGKMRQLFEAASRLPRSQQQKVAAVLEPFIAVHGNGQ